MAHQTWQGRSRSLPKVLAAVCLLAPFVALLWVPFYAGKSPGLFGAPYFYWYQFGWAFLTPALMAVACLALHRWNRGDE